MTHPALRSLAHRPWPVPARPWVLAMRWQDLLFAHWPYPAEAVRPLVPPSLELDLWEGAAWVSVVPFVMRGTRPRGVPALPVFSTFPELNVRTYVTAAGKPGVWFFSLDAASRLAVRAARAAFHLPYFDARMRAARRGETVRYRSERTHHGAPPARFAAMYRAEGYPWIAQPGTLDHFLAERYCLYSARPDGRALRLDVQHPPWVLQAATAEIRENSMLAAAGLPPPAGAPLLRMAGDQDVVAWWAVALPR